MRTDRGSDSARVSPAAAGSLHQKAMPWSAPGTQRQVQSANQHCQQQLRTPLLNTHDVEDAELVPVVEMVHGAGQVDQAASTVGPGESDSEPSQHSEQSPLLGTRPDVSAASGIAAASNKKNPATCCGGPVAFALLKATFVAM